MITVMIMILMCYYNNNIICIIDNHINDNIDNNTNVLL